MLLALTFLKGAPAWNAVSGWLFSLFGVITYAVAPVALYLAFLIAAGRPAKAKIWQGGLLLCMCCALALIFSRLDLSSGSFFETFLSLGDAGRGLRGGGLLSALIGWPLLSLCGRPAANVIIVVMVAIFFMLLTNTTPVDLYRLFREKAGGAKDRFAEYERNAAAARAAREERRQREREEAIAELEAEQAAPCPRTASGEHRYPTGHPRQHRHPARQRAGTAGLRLRAAPGRHRPERAL